MGTLISAFVQLLVLPLRLMAWALRVVLLPLKLLGFVRKPRRVLRKVGLKPRHVGAMALVGAMAAEQAKREG